MANFNGVFIAKVTQFMKSGSQTDANGHTNIILTPIAGKCPSKRVIAGSLALTQGFVPGDVVAVSFTEGQRDEEYGRQFNFTNMGRLSTLETLGALSQFGNPEIVDVEDDNLSTAAPTTPAEKAAEMQENTTE